MSRTAPPARRRPFANSNTAARGRLLAENLLRRARMRSPAVQSRPVYERPGYRTLLGGIVLIAIGVVAFLWLPELVLAALLLTIALAIGTGAMGYGGYSRLELHGPTRTIKSMKETVRWAKQRLLGRSAS